jgi:hypothetical protein
MDRQQATAMTVASYLHRLGFNVHYPGLPGHPGKEIHDRLASGPGAVLSFHHRQQRSSASGSSAQHACGESVSALVRSTRSSACPVPCRKSPPTVLSRLVAYFGTFCRHASIDSATRAARGLPEDLIRLCVGIEDAQDLVEDLESALIEAGVQLPALLPSVVGLKSPFTYMGVPAVPVAVSREGSIRSPKQEWLVSAPGKVILFGEHAVVHGVVS